MKNYNLLIILIDVILYPYTASATTVASNETNDCKKIPEDVLGEILGPAFNGHYMRIDMPYPDDNPRNMLENKRKIDSEGTIAVDASYAVDEFDEQPAWEVWNHALYESHQTTGTRRKRELKREINYMQEWNCKSIVAWIDLGVDYFPRYLKSVECLRKNCWFNIFNCRPRSFVLKVLKRKRDKCVKTNIPGHRIGVKGLPKELTELWVWEERAVTFCCDCRL